MSKSIPPMDMAFLLTETSDSPKHVAAILRFEPPAAGRTHRVADIVAAYRKAEPAPPFNYLLDKPAVGLPRWKTAKNYDPNYHVQHLLLPPGSNDDALLALAADLTESVLDRNRPLFRAWFIEGLDDGSFAVFVKIHHAIVDGKTAMDRMVGGLSVAADGEVGRPFFAIDAPVHRPRVPKNVLQKIIDVQSSTRKQGSALLDVSLGLLKKGVSRLLAGSSSGSMPFIAPRTLMNEGIRAPRAIATLSLPLQEMRAVGKAFGGTINDVAVAVFDEALHRYLRQLGKDTSAPLVGMLPVSLREADDKEATTKVSAMFVPLGLPTTDPVQRMGQVIEGIRSAKDDLRKMSKDAALLYGLSLFGLTELAEITPASRLPSAGASFILSNVPGVPHALYLNGVKLKSIIPVSTLGGGIGLNATLASYNGAMDFGIAASSLSLPRLGELAAHCEQAFAELKQAAAARAAPAEAAPAQPAAKAPARRKAAARRAPAAAKAAAKTAAKKSPARRPAGAKMA